MRFSYSNIKFKKHAEENWLMVSGEIHNESGKSFNTVLFRMVLYIKTIPVASFTFIIRGLLTGQSKTFEVRAEELDTRLIPQITRCEIYPESAY